MSQASLSVLKNKFKAARGTNISTDFQNIAGIILCNINNRSQKKGLKTKQICKNYICVYAYFIQILVSKLAYGKKLHNFLKRDFLKIQVHLKK